MPNIVLSREESPLKLWRLTEAAGTSALVMAAYIGVHINTLILAEGGIRMSVATCKKLARVYNATNGQVCYAFRRAKKARSRRTKQAQRASEAPEGKE